jgi:Rieske Fe-S protein
VATRVAFGAGYAVRTLAGVGKNPSSADASRHRVLYNGVVAIIQDRRKNLTMPEITRRQMLRSGATAAASLAAADLLASCIGSPTASGPSKSLIGKPLLAVDEVPVGGGQILANDHVVVTQPTKGTFHVFSSTCTHEGCTVNQIRNGTIDCPCHGSRFSIVNGAVKAGPAPRPLPEYGSRVKAGYLELT